MAVFDFGNLGLECGEEWVPFPVLENLDLKVWARHATAEVAERFISNGERGFTSELESDLRRRAADSRTREPLAAFGWYLNGYPNAAAIMELDGMVPDDIFPELTLSLLAEKMKAYDFGDPEIQNVRLPLGPAVRIRQNVVGQKKRRFFGSQPVVRTLAYAVRPIGTEVALTMYVSWLEPVIDEPVTQAADNIAQTLRL